MKSNFKNKINKYVEYFITKLKQFLKQKYFKYKNVVIKYIKKKNKKSDSLIVIFSACTRPGISARYNYVRTLKNIKANKLFILDDFGLDKRGGFYLGEYPEFLFEESTKNLIDSIIKKYNYKKIFFVGSSKGGYAALNFGFLYKNAIMIVGAPQYFLGRFLAAPANKITIDGMKIESQEDILEIDRRLENRIKNNKNSNCQKIYIHYSNKEHTFEDHISELIKTLQSEKYNLVEEIMDYTEHGDVSFHYPKFLINSLKEEGVEEND